jgi:four helix bundle protein
MEEKESGRRDLQQRTRAFAVRIVRLFVALARNNVAAQGLGKQALRSGTSVGAQYREACRARSRAEFTSKIDACLQELEETRYWFELLVESDIIPEKRLKPLMDEARELTAILTASARTAKRVNG